MDPARCTELHGLWQLECVALGAGGWAVLAAYRAGLLAGFFEISD
jgi:hypothetical protein